MAEKKCPSFLNLVSAQSRICCSHPNRRHKHSNPSGWFKQPTYCCSSESKCGSPLVAEGSISMLETLPLYPMKEKSLPKGSGWAAIKSLTPAFERAHPKSGIQSLESGLSHMENTRPILHPWTGDSDCKNCGPTNFSPSEVE